ncbi:MAG: flavodoxin family protein [Desulfobacteraceae bacterium]|nr:flavodoxin family protein [Desulfobacteraceae bacterium]
MKVIGINGSARKDGNTAILVKYVFEELRKAGIETELIQLAGHDIRGCKACYKCFEKLDGRCAMSKDYLNTCLDKMKSADGIILASPTYFTDVSAEMKALIDRAGLVAKANGDLLRRKVGAGVVAVRRAGSTHVFDTLNHFFFISQMIVPGSSYWNMGFGLEKGEVEKDEEGIQTMRLLGQNMAWLLKRIHADESCARSDES